MAKFSFEVSNKQIGELAKNGCIGHDLLEKMQHRAKQHYHSDNPCFRKLTVEGSLMIPAMLSNSSTIAKNGGTVFDHVCSDFDRWGLNNEVVISTKEIEVDVYKSSKPSLQLKDVFSFKNKDLSELRLTQSQIIDFVELHKSWLGLLTVILFQDSNSVAIISKKSKTDTLCIGHDVINTEIFFKSEDFRVIIPV